MESENSEYFNKFDSSSQAILRSAIAQVKEKDRKILLPSDILLEIALSGSEFFTNLCRLLDLEVVNVIAELSWMSRDAWKTENTKNTEGVYVTERCRQLFKTAKSKSSLFVIPVDENADLINIPGLLFAAMLPKDEEFAEILRLAGKSADYDVAPEIKPAGSTEKELEPNVISVGKWVKSCFRGLGGTEPTDKELSQGLTSMVQFIENPFNLSRADATTQREVRIIRILAGCL